MQTELTLSIGGLPPLSARGCVQDLKPVAQGELKRTLNGELLFVGHAAHKYRSTLRCTDQTAMATDGLPVGAEVVVGCIQPLCQKVGAHGGVITVTLDRLPVEGSVSVIDDNKKPLEGVTVAGRTVTLPGSERDVFIFYNPQLTMRVLSFSLQTDEWSQKASWTLDLEEI
ncbi:hypothetical protein AGMMS49949_02200 [Alphaproteobacteria bacterium]|nr:hypothetical protein AGMMS49949_02200 [Alphaproteobacteria bacterium]GHS96105.1 hypothetical protein AGMMS50296_1900 [Alphaproteobacteria bacterium]